MLEKQSHTLSIFPKPMLKIAGAMYEHKEWAWYVRRLYFHFSTASTTWLRQDEHL